MKTIVEEEKEFTPKNPKKIEVTDIDVDAINQLSKDIEAKEKNVKKTTKPSLKVIKKISSISDESFDFKVFNPKTLLQP